METEPLVIRNPALMLPQAVIPVLGVPAVILAQGVMPTPAVIQEPGLSAFPSNTKARAENQTIWYKQFARQGLLSIFCTTKSFP